MGCACGQRKREKRICAINSMIDFGKRTRGLSRGRRIRHLIKPRVREERIEDPVLRPGSLTPITLWSHSSLQRDLFSSLDFRVNILSDQRLQVESERKRRRNVSAAIDIAITERERKSGQRRGGSTSESSPVHRLAPQSTLA